MQYLFSNINLSPIWHKIFGIVSTFRRIHPLVNTYIVPSSSSILTNVIHSFQCTHTRVVHLVMAHPVIIKAARQRVIPTYLLLLADYPADQVLHEELRKTLVCISQVSSSSCLRFEIFLSWVIHNLFKSSDLFDLLIIRQIVVLVILF